MDLDLPREYVMLGLRFNRLEDGLVDAYTGEEDLRRQVEAEPTPDPAAMAARAGDLLAELPAAGLAEDRTEFLYGQLTALHCAAQRMAGATIPYVEEVHAYYQVRPQRAETDRYAHVHDRLRALLPGSGDLTQRYAVYRNADRCPPERLSAALGVLSEALRDRVGATIGLPRGESVDYGIVTGKPWSGFNYYLGGYRSRVEVNADLPQRLAHLPHLVAHESYPGHHTHNCHKEQRLVRTGGRLEHTVYMVNTPECLVAEGLAEVGVEMAVGPGWGRWMREVLAGVGLAVDGELCEEVSGAVAGLDRVRLDAALMLHDEGASADDVVRYMSRWLLVPEARARDSLRFIADPLWRAYASTYVEGYRLVTAWLEARPAAQPLSARFSRLLDEPLTPARMTHEMKPVAGAS